MKIEEVRVKLQAVTRARRDVEQLLDRLDNDHMWQIRDTFPEPAKTQVQPFIATVDMLRASTPRLEGAERILRTIENMEGVIPDGTVEEAMEASDDVLATVGPVKEGIVAFLNWSRSMQNLPPEEGMDSSAN